VSVESIELTSLRSLISELTWSTSSCGW